MKKIRNVTCLLLFVILLLSLSLTAFAESEPTLDEHAQMIHTACDVFPEYADKIRNTPPISEYRTFSKPEIARIVARETADGELLTYSEYSDGIVLLSSADVSPTGSSYKVIDSNTTDYWRSFRVTSNISYQVLTVSNIHYRVSSGIASIIDRGEANTDCGVTHLFYSVEYRQQEEPLSNACTGFTCNWTRIDPGHPYELTFMFYATGYRWWTSARY